MKKSISKLKQDKITESKETIIESTLSLTIIIKDIIEKDEAKKLLNDILKNGNFDHYEIKEVKAFQRGV